MDSGKIPFLPGSDRSKASVLRSPATAPAAWRRWQRSSAPRRGREQVGGCAGGRLSCSKYTYAKTCPLWVADDEGTRPCRQWSKAGGEWRTVISGVARKRKPRWRRRGLDGDCRGGVEGDPRLVQSIPIWGRQVVRNRMKNISPIGR